ncbi:hypothetical protein BDV12DRAFT_185566 [Aspergillus spectabilis]
MATSTWLAKPPATCCMQGTLHSGTPRGQFKHIAGVKTYITHPQNDPNGHVLLYFPDIWGMFTNGLLVMDAFADAGYTVIGLDYFRGDPVWKHRRNRHDKSDPSFDYEAWKSEHMKFADEAVPGWVEAVKKEFGQSGTKYACVGYCFGAPYICDLLASDAVSAGAFGHPAFLKERHFVKLPRYQAFAFADEVAIVTGAGSRMSGEIGNGRATAILLARQGAKVVLVDYNPDWANETKKMIENEGAPGEAIVVQADVTDEESCKRVVETTVEKFGGVSILVNIVGVGGAMGDATKLDLAAWERDFRINVTSMVLMSRFVIPEMRKVNVGQLSICPVSGLLGGNPSLLYPTTKGAIIQMTRAMAAQHGPENIRVNCVCPGMVYTPMVRGRGMTDEMRQARINQNLMKREVDGWDVGYAILFLCSKEAKWITGWIMPVDGGTTAGKADRPALKADTFAEKNTGVPNAAESKA